MIFGIGRKDGDGKQVRIEHRGKYIRASRTGGVALRVEKKFGPINVTANSSKGLRASTRIARGTRIALQNGRVQLIGRWRAGPFGINLSKGGMSASVKNRAGAFNFLKPQYSSFKLAGIQVRGRKAAQLQFLFIAISAALTAVFLIFWALAFLLWMTMLPFYFLWGACFGFIRGIRKINKLNSNETSAEL